MWLCGFAHHRVLLLVWSGVRFALRYARRVPVWRQSARLLCSLGSLERRIDFRVYMHWVVVSNMIGRLLFFISQPLKAKVCSFMSKLRLVRDLLLGGSIRFARRTAQCRMLPIPPEYSQHGKHI